MSYFEPETTQAAVALRRALHREPDLSNQEARTARAILKFIDRHPADDIVQNLGGAGVAAIYRGEREGPTVLFRAELDALPITEINDCEHRSSDPHVSHKCGHDGHMAMVAGLAPLLHRRRPGRGRVVLLFQPAEETGEGAAAVLRDPRFAGIEPDYAFAIHNLPGYPRGEIVVRERVFTMASIGLAIHLEGRTSHASEPEKGLSPASALTVLVSELPRLPATTTLEGFGLVTLTHAALGERSFGISPGRAEVLATLRAENDEDLERLRARAAETAASAARAQGLTVRIEWSDHFAASVNHPLAVREIVSAAAHLGVAVHAPPAPMRWSEDFGLFTRATRGALFCLGAGVDHPALHSPDYDFPDEIVPTGVALYSRIIEQLLNT